MARHPLLRNTTLNWLLLIGLGALGVRLLIATNLQGSALLYLGMPWGLAVLLALFTRPADQQRWWAGVTNTLRTGLIVMLGSSLLLGEGFLCVLMFLPIFLGVLLLVYLVMCASKLFEKGGRGRASAQVAPLLLGLLALEGTHENLSFERDTTVTVTRTTQQTPAELMANLNAPVELAATRSTGLSALFPQPYRVDTPGLFTGAEHQVHYRYARWVWGNVHEGTLRLRMAQVSPQHVAVKVLEDTSYLANYMELQGTSIHIEADHSAATNQTSTPQYRVTLSIHYRRTLDPAWYFAPLQRSAIRQIGEHALTHIILKEETTDGYGTG